LDEPTNNLDIIAKGTLLEALRRFPGTVVMVSHDRYILNQLVTQVIEVGHGHAIRYLGNYDDYLAKKEQEATAESAKLAARPLTPVGDADHSEGNGTAPARSRERNRAASDASAEARREAERRRGHAERQRAQVETRIEAKEAERAALAADMNDPNFDLARQDANELIARYEQLGREIERLYQDRVATEQLEDSAD
ncbi:MAG: multidrug ABC transporter ATP-binding protein, partial [Candidatus Binataceae bacterium]